jgi:outer membrane immunogenic protein
MSFDVAAPTVQCGNSELTCGGLIMKKLLLAGVAGLALAAAGSADAADLGRPVYKAPPPVAPVPVRVFSWTGCYVGANIGGAWGKKDFSSGAPDVLVVNPNKLPTDLTPEVEVNLFNVNSLLVSSGAFNDIDTSGFIGGGQLGCNYQFGVGKGLGGPGAWVIGFDGDFDWGNVKGDRSGSVSASEVEAIAGVNRFVTTSATGTMHVKTDFLATATGRLGYAWDRWLFYGKGGVAVAHDKYDLTTTATETIQAIVGGNPDGTLFSQTANLFFDAKQRRVGWTAGVGVEWAFLDNWTAKVEWDWLDFGTKDISFALGPEEVATWSVKQHIMELKFGINYLFNWGGWGKGKGKAPVVARY